MHKGPYYLGKAPLSIRASVSHQAYLVNRDSLTVEK